MSPLLVEVTRVPPGTSEHLAPVWQPFVDKALRRAQSPVSVDLVSSWVTDCTAQLWVVRVAGKVMAWVVTRVLDGGELHVQALTGKAPSTWLDALVDALGKFGLEHGCGELTACGRRGWLRAIPGSFELPDGKMAVKI